MMTPERRGEIDAILQMSYTREDCDTRFEWRLIQALMDSVDEIGRLNKVVSQAIDLSEMDISEINGRIWCDERSLEAASCPELADELKKRLK